MSYIHKIFVYVYTASDCRVFSCISMLFIEACSPTYPDQAIVGHLILWYNSMHPSLTQRQGSCSSSCSYNLIESKTLWHGILLYILDQREIQSQLFACVLQLSVHVSCSTLNCVSPRTHLLGLCLLCFQNCLSCRLWSNAPDFYSLACSSNYACPMNKHEPFFLSWFPISY